MQKRQAVEVVAIGHGLLSQSLATLRSAAEEHPVCRVPYRRAEQAAQNIAAWIVSQSGHRAPTPADPPDSATLRIVTLLGDALFTASGLAFHLRPREVELQAELQRATDAAARTYELVSAALRLLSDGTQSVTITLDPARSSGYPRSRRAR